MDMTTVSVVIPCFNHARFVGEAIDSALAQTGGAVEVIVVDDGSTDDSAAIATRYSQARLLRQPNAGLSRARNAGLQVCNGEVVIFLDADDRLLPNAATSALRAFRRHPLAAMVFGRCELIDTDGRPLPTNLPVVRANHYQELLQRNYIWMPAMAAFRRSALVAVGGFDPKVDASADYDMYLRVSRTALVGGHDDLVAQYRQHAFVQDDRELRAAYDWGQRHWRAFYGEQLVERFRRALHDGRTVDAARDAWRLLRRYPAGVRHHLCKKALLTARELRHSPR
jgi:glycosyltransferase involved in cell wall biosynthesis